MTDTTPLAAALQPLIQRVRTDVTAVKKPSGEQAWTQQPLTAERLQRHLNGGPPRGVAPIKPGEYVTLVAVLDFDSHGGEVGWLEMSRAAHGVAELLEMHGMEPILWRSTGGRGLHLYLMWNAPQPAFAVRAFLGDVLAAVGLRNGTRGVGAGQVEVFPKQDHVPVGGHGNQFILPLAGKSELLEWVDLADEYAPVPRDQVAATAWVCSPPVPLLDVHPTIDASSTLPPPVDSATGELLWRDALDRIPNGPGEADRLDYDAWRNVVFGIHHETGGSDSGLALVHEFSKRSPNYDAEFIDNRVWPYVNSQRGGAVVTGRSIMSIASRYGWTEPLDESAFTVEIDPDDDTLGDDDDFQLGSDQLSGDDAAVCGDGGSADLAVDHVGRDLAGDGPAAQAERSSGAVQAGAPGADQVRDSVGKPAGRRGGIPEARHLTTDQANANRLVRQYGRRVLVAAGRWHVFDGRRWAADEADVYRYGCNLSKIVGEEAEEWSRKAARLTGEIEEKMGSALALLEKAEGMAKEDPRRAALIGEANMAIAASSTPEERKEIEDLEELATKLQKWSARSEMKASIEAAIGLSAKMLTVDAAMLDKDPMLLNCINGTLDLFSGDVRPHAAKDLLTKLIDVPVQEADPSAWEAIVAAITGEDGLPHGQRNLTRFLQRWFGYCATGSVREQALVVHWGSGRNGKSTLIETIARVLGDYAGVAAPGLLTNDGKGFERHPTEVASLLGKRMVTAHESEEGATLREGFIKQATGSDTMKARYMREDFFDFPPTHKLQLLTNHKPTIKGNDPGIWRRVLLVPYTQSFGTAEQLERREVTRVADKALGEALKGDAAMLRGVLAWIVAGAIEWASDGLNPPAVVLAASKTYQDEQDRVGQFVRECCEVAPASEHAGVIAGTSASWCEPLTHGMGGLYPAYQSWAKDGGFHALARTRFLESLKSTLPAISTSEKMTSSKDGAATRRKILRVFGLRLLADD